MQKTTHNWSRASFNAVQPTVQCTMRTIEATAYITQVLCNSLVNKDDHFDNTKTWILKLYFLLKHFTRYIREDDRMMFREFCIDISLSLTVELDMLLSDKVNCHNPHNMNFVLHPKYIALFSQKVCSDLGLSDCPVNPASVDGYVWKNVPFDPDDLFHNIVDYGSNQLNYLCLDPRKRRAQRHLESIIVRLKKNLVCAKGEFRSE